jgi:hypothetical protein
VVVELLATELGEVRVLAGGEDVVEPAGVFLVAVLDVEDDDGAAGDDDVDGDREPREAFALSGGRRAQVAFSGAQPGRAAGDVGRVGDPLLDQCDEVDAAFRKRRGGSGRARGGGRLTLE